MSLASGALGGKLDDLMYVRTPPTIASAIRRIIALPQARVNVLEPTAGTGELLLPWLGCNTTITAIELEQERADQLQLRSRTHTNLNVYNTAFQNTRLTQSYGLALVNPPYYFQNGRRAEYSIIRDAGNTLVPGGILVAVIAARSSLEHHLIQYLAKNFTNLRCWKFPHRGQEEESFLHFSQIVIIGEKREQPLINADMVARANLQCWKYDSQRQAWGGEPPPDITQEQESYYTVPTASDYPQVRVIQATDDMLLQALETYGAHQSQRWANASTWEPEQVGENSLLMNVYGASHVAALVLNTDEFRGKPITGPDGQTYIFHTHVGIEFRKREVEEEERQRGVVEVDQQQDLPTLVWVRLGDGATGIHQREDVFTFLKDWMPLLVQQVVERYVPLYQLDPTDEEIRVVNGVCRDKRLPGQEHPGLLISQQHRVYALHRATNTKRRAAIQGEPGTGKTRQCIAVMALKAHEWKQRQ